MRLGEVIAWQEQWVHGGLHGFRPAHGAEDVFWGLALRLEEALLSGEDLAGFSLDYAKCFDKVPVAISLRLAEEVGMSKEVLRGLRGMYAQLERRFKVAGGVGSPWQSTNGILQGCPLCVILLTLLVTVWARAVEEEVPLGLPAL